MILVTNLSGNDGTANHPTLPVREFSVLTRLDSYSRESGRLPVVRALFQASARRGVLVNGSAGHGLKKNTQERHKKHLCNIRPESHIDGK